MLGAQLKQVTDNSLITVALMPGHSEIPRETYTQMSSSNFVLILFKFLIKLYYWDN